MVINSQRADKAEKDAAAVLGIWQYLDRQKLDVVLKALEKKEFADATEFMRTYGLEEP